MTAILDTGFIFALTDKTDDNHTRVLRVAQIIDDEPLVLPSVVIPNLQ
jgi:predicted nucleic acid-binding protein